MSPDQFAPVTRKSLERLDRSSKITPRLVGILVVSVCGVTKGVEAVPSLDEH